mgnify:CR=1 FL=1
MATHGLRKQRQGFVLNLEKIAADIISATDPSNERLIFWEEKITLYQGQIEKLSERLSSLIVDEQEIEQESFLVVTLFEKAFDARARLKAFASTSKFSAAASTVVVDSSTGPRSGSNANQVRLPKLQLRRFTGNELEWQEFIAMFDVSVHQTDLPPIQKFIHLKSLLSNEAALCVANIELSDQNYAIAYDRLTARFGDTMRGNEAD